MSNRLLVFGCTLLLSLAALPAQAQTFSPIPNPALANQGSIAYGIALGDIDHDGDLDAFWAQPGASAQLWLNDGSGVFTQSAYTFPDTYFKYKAEAADFNQDGWVDVVFASETANNESCFTQACDPNVVYLNNQDGTFSLGWTDGQAWGTRNVAVGDFNGDSWPDLAFANTGAGEGTVWINKALGGAGFGFTQVSLQNAPTSTGGVAVGNIGGSVHDDVVFGDGSHYISDGNGGFGSKLSLANVNGLHVDILDLDGAYGNDVVFSGNFHPVAVVLSQPNGTFANPVNYGSGAGYRFEVRPADLDHDGDLDLAVAGNTENAFINTGGVLSPVGGLGFTDKGLAVGDLDGDGRTDVLTSYPAKVMRNVLPSEVFTTSDSGAGSLRSAILWANSNPGLDTITFNIPGAGPHTIAPQTALPFISDPVRLDGCSQPGASCAGNIEDYDLRVILAGSAFTHGQAPYADGLRLVGSSTNSTIRGLVINQFNDKGIRINSGQNTIEAVYIGTDVTGTQDLGTGGNCIEMEGAASQGNTVQESLLSGCTGSGVHFEPGATGNTIQANRIGTTANGRGRLPLGGASVGSNQADGNVIVDNTLLGQVSLFAGSDNYVIQQNYMGTNPEGDNVALSSGVGVWVDGNNNLIGGFLSPGLGNTFGYLQRPVRVLSGSGNSVRQNTMVGIQNGIELAAGTNGNIARPTLNGAHIVAGELEVTFTTAVQGEIEVYKARANRQVGDLFIGSPIPVNTNGQLIPVTSSMGTAASLGIQVGDYLVVNVTDGAGNTSLFSGEVPVALIDPLVVTTVNDAGTGSLRAAIDFANGNPGPDTITFEIPGAASDVHVIQLLSALPALAESLEIDGTSQGDATCSSPDLAQIRVELDGSLLNTSSDHGLYLTAGDVTVRGLAIRDMPKDGIHLAVGSDGATIMCNFIGTNAGGLVAAGNGRSEAGVGVGVMIRSADNLVRDNLIVASSYDEIRFEGAATGNAVEGNYVGVNRAQVVTPAPLTPNHADPNRVGIVLSAGADANIFSGNRVGGFTDGFYVGSDGNAFDANYVGVGPQGESFHNARGFFIGSGSNNLIETGNQIANNDHGVWVAGGTGNRIAENAIFQNGNGVLVAQNVNQTTISQNSIYLNSGKGISLQNGANQGINTPYMSQAFIDDAGDLVVRMVVIGTGTAEFFKADSQASGQGQTFLASPQSYPQSGVSQRYVLGNAAALGVSAGDFVVVTLTDGGGNTSEFAAPYEVLPGDPLIVVNTNDSGPGSLRAAIDFANGNAGYDVITFDIPGAATDVHVIQTQSPLPGLAGIVKIDGVTQGDATCLLPGTSQLRIVLDGSQQSGNLGSPGFHLTDSGVEIWGIAIVNMPHDGIRVEPGSVVNTLRCLHVGTDAGGLVAAGNGRVTPGTGVTVLGGITRIQRSILLANSYDEIRFEGASAINNEVTQSYVGVNRNLTAIASDKTTINIGGQNLVGVAATPGANTSTFASNVVGGYDAEGFVIQSDGNSFDDNHIGVGPGGEGFGNGTGVRVLSGVGNVIQNGNRIANNGTGVGVASNVSGLTVSGNSIQNNSIGVQLGSNTDQVVISQNSLVGNATPFDLAGDANGGPVDLDILSAELDGGDNLVLNVLTGISGATVEFFKADATGTQGETYLASDTSPGNNDIYTLADAGLLGVVDGDQIIATITGPSGTWGYSTVATVGPNNPLLVTTDADSGPGSLRAAIAYSNANPGAGGPNQITFDINLGGASSAVIRPATALPSISAPVVIDGTSQAGATCGTAISDRVLKIVLDGSLMPFSLTPGAPNPDALFIEENTNNVTVQGLVINQFPGTGIQVRDGNSGVVIRCNYIGTDELGTGAFGNYGHGVQVAGYGTVSTGNLIGGPNPEDGNLIAANGYTEIQMEPGANTNTIQNNYIGTTKTGAALRGAAFSVDAVEYDPYIDRVGIGVNQARGNAILGNVVGGFGTGIEIFSSQDYTAAAGNIVRGNSIGTDVSGTVNLGNGTGVSLGGSGQGSELVGGSLAGQGNTIMFNGTGIGVQDAPAHQVRGNMIQANTEAGIHISGPGSPDLLIANNAILDNRKGIAASQARLATITGNVISGSSDRGVSLENSAVDNVITGNTIGLESDGDTPRGNLVGVMLELNAAQNTISANTISGNSGSGLVMTSGSFSNVVTGNIMGLNAAETAARPNGAEAIAITFGALQNVVTGNVLSGNTQDGIILFEAGTANTIKGNFIGTSSDGQTAFPNQWNGIDIIGRSSGGLTVIGGTAPGEGNVIAYHPGAGIILKDILAPAPYVNATILRNSIFQNARIGIDLTLTPGDVQFQGDLITANDPVDSDVGPNGLLNNPSMQSARLVDNALLVDLFFKSATGSTVTLEFFKADASGTQGKTYIGSKTVTSGETLRTLDLDGTGLTTSDRIVATATDVNGYTSEFSNPVPVEDLPVSVPSGYVYQTIVSSGLVRPTSVAVGTNDVVYVADSDQNAVYRYDANGGSFTLVAGGFSVPSSVAVSPTGALVVVDAGGLKSQAGAILATQVTSPTVVRFGPQGCRFVGGANGVEKTCGAVSTMVITGTANARGLAWNKAGDLFVSRAGGDIVTFPAGSAPASVGSLKVVQTGLTSPGAMSFAENDLLFVSTPSGVLYGYASSPALQQFAGMSGSGPNGLAIGSKSRMFVTHASRGTVLRFSVPEQQSATTLLTFEVSDRLGNMLSGVDAAIQAAVATWHGVGSALASSKIALSPTRAPGGLYAASIGDNRNLITVDPSFPIGSQTLAVASKLIRVGATPEDAEVLTADIVFNERFDPANQNGSLVGNFGTDLQPAQHDIRGIATHELGHTMGLIHSGIPDATMFFILPKTARNLTPDDEAQVSRRYPNPTQAANFGTIAGKVTSGNPATLGRPVAGALLIATDIASGVGVHTYADRDGNYQIKYLPAGNYRVGLFALDGSLFQAKWPLTPGRVSLLLQTITTETSFLEEYYNGANESATDVRSEYTLVSVASGGTTGNINLITNLDTTPPRVTGVTPAANTTGVPLKPSITVTFSEGVLLETASATIRATDCVSTGCATPLTLTMDKDGGRFGFITTATPLNPSVQYELSVNGAQDKAGNRQSVAFTSRFTTRTADTTAPTVVASTPADGATGVSASTLVTVSFSEPMDAATITSNGNVVLRPVGGQAIEGALSLPSNTSLAFKPDLPLAAGISYELVLNGLKDPAGNALGTTVRTFSTPTNPTFTTGLFGPAQGTSGVSIQSHVFVDFSVPVLATTLNTTSFAVRPVGVSTGPGIPGAFSLLNGGTRVVFAPAAELTPFETYTVSLSGSIQDVFLRPLNAPPSWSFSVGSAGFQIYALSPRTATEGAKLTIDGSGFHPDASQNTVTFSGLTGPIPAPVTRSTVSSLAVVVPLGTVSGPVTVATNGSGSGTVQFELYVAPALSDPALKVAETDSSPRDVEVSPDGTLAIVTNSGSDSVTLIDITTGQETSVPVGRTPLRVTVTPDGGRAYVTNYNSHSVSVIDLGCAQGPTAVGCVKEIPVGYNPIGITVSPDGSLVYVAEYSSKSVSIIDAIPSSGTYNLAIRTLSTDTTTREVVTDPDGGKILASESSPRDVESNPDGTGIWIATDYGIIATEVNLAIPQSEWAVTILVSESSAREANVSPDGGITILASEGTVRTVSADPDGGTTIKTGEGTVRDVESNPDGTMLFMTTGPGELLVYAIPPDPYGNDPYKAVTKLGSDATAREVEVSPDGTLVYVTSFETGTVSIYSFGAGLTTDTPTAISGIGFGLVLLDVVQVGDKPEGIAYSPVANFAAVANSGSDTVTILSFETFGTPPPPDGLGDPLEDDLDDDGISDVRRYIATTVGSLGSEATSAEDQDDYAKALKHATENLNPDLWSASTGMPSGKKGNKVFDNDKQIVKALSRIVQRNGSGAAVASALIQEYLIPLDRDIASLAIASAQGAIQTALDSLAVVEADIISQYGASCGKKDKACKDAVQDLEDGYKDVETAQDEVAKAQEEFAKAQTQLLQGKTDKAFDGFKKAWDHTTHAMDDLAGKGYEDEPEQEELPFEFSLSQNYPNPFNPATTIEFALPETADVKLEVFDMLGRRVQTLVSGKMDAGFHTVQFNARDLASGIYLYRIQAGAYTQVQRMVLMK